MTDKTHPTRRAPDSHSTRATASDDDALLAFEPESGHGDRLADFGAAPGVPPLEPTKQRSLRSWLTWSLLAIIATTATTSLVALGPIRVQMPKERAVVATGRVTLETVPPGSEVFIDGQSRGFTPLSVTLDPGHHETVVHHGAEERLIPLEVALGAELTQRIEFAGTIVAPSRLTILSEPSGARVVVDGEWRGVSPITVQGLAAGRHRVVVAGGGVSADRMVVTEAGTAASVVFSLPANVPETNAGWLVIEAPFEVRAVERNEVIGTSAAARIMVTPGRHEFDFVNPALGYVSRRRVDIGAGRTETVKLDARAPLDINARPWAEVTVDGTTVGITPIANYVLTLGNHRVTFHNPDLGDQQQDVVVTLMGPNRISVDLMK